MIRVARSSERSEVFKIWKACFGDDDAYIELFLEKLYTPGKCLLYTVNGLPVAMLHLLPLNCSGLGQDAEAGYIYAAATLPEFRRRGIMAELIEFAVGHGEKMGYRFTALMPANEGLYGYYAKCGFSTTLRLASARVGRAELERVADGASPVERVKPDAGLMYNQRINFFKPALLWGRELFEYALAEWQFTGGEVIASQSGYCLYKRSSAALFIKELCIQEAGFPPFAAALLKEYGGGSFNFNLAEGTKLFESSSIRNGALRLRDGVEDPGDIERAYFNMMLD